MTLETALVGARDGHGRILALDAIAVALDALAKMPPTEWHRREGFSPEIVRWMLDGYRLLDDMLVRGADPFAIGSSRLLVELNHHVLCGRDPKRRLAFATHIAETENRFYNDRMAGADAFFAWANRSLGTAPLVAAAAVYVRIVSAPQLFVEGNQRTATLIASFLLVRGGLPPLVATPETAAGFYRISAQARAIRRDGWIAPFEVAIAERRLRRHLARCLDPAFLRLQPAN